MPSQAAAFFRLCILLQLPATNGVGDSREERRAWGGVVGEGGGGGRVVTWQLVGAKAAEQSIDIGEYRAAGLVQVCQLLQVAGYLLLWDHSAQLRFVLEEADDKLFP